LSKRTKIEIYLIILILLLFTFRGSIPFFKYPFILLFSCLILYSLFNFKKAFRTNCISRNFCILIFVLIIPFIYSFFITEKVYLAVFKDIINIFLLFSIYLAMLLFIKNLEDLSFFVKNLVRLIICFAIIISLYEIGKDFYIISGENLSFRIDYNFAIIPIIFGMIGLLFYLPDKNSLIKEFAYSILLTIFSVSIFLSGSRRGIIILILIISYLIVSQILTFFNRNLAFIKLRNTLIFFVLLIISLILSSYAFINYTSGSFKNRALNNIGSKDIPAAKEKINFVILRYLTALNKHYNLADINKLIWTPVLDPKDPDSGWGYRKHKTVFPLTGDNVEIVPSETKGYLLDNTCTADEWGGNSYSFTKLYTNKVSDSDIVDVSVFCFVSGNYDGDWVRIVLSSDNLSWIASNSYNLVNKGTWQKLSISTKCKEKEVSLFLYLCKYGTSSFKSLNGYVIFAYPQCRLTSGDSISQNVFTCKDSVSGPFNNLNVEIKEKDKLFHQTYNETSIFYLSKFFSNIIFPVRKDTDPIRNWLSKLISEDTTYYKYNANLLVDKVSNPFIDQRKARWQFAWQIFIKEYKWSNRIFGGGFNFLNWYGYYFDGDKTRSDYPHNPFLSVLLYSGIIGLIFYLIFMYKVFQFYFKYYKEYQILSIFFIITFYFSFFSSGNPFDPPIMGFFVILPFFIHSIHQKETGESMKVTDAKTHSDKS
jgi:hypothetical protein